MDFIQPDTRCTSHSESRPQLTYFTISNFKKNFENLMELILHFVQKLKKKSTNNKPESQGKKLEFAAEMREISRCAWFVHLLVVGVSLERQ